MTVILLGSFFSYSLGQETATTEEKPAAPEHASEDAKPPVWQKFTAYEGRLQLSAPSTWKKVKPRSNLIEVEFSIPPAEADGVEKTDPIGDVEVPHGRLTMMSAGGDVDANIRRWISQFRLGRDADGKDAMKREEKKIECGVVHTLDIAGTFFDSPRGPFGPKIERPDYRMLGAIIEVNGAGKFFIKFYGPAKLVERNQKAFEKMLAKIKSTDTEAEANAENATDGKAVPKSSAAE